MKQVAYGVLVIGATLGLSACGPQSTPEQTVEITDAKPDPVPAPAAPTPVETPASHEESATPVESSAPDLAKGKRQFAKCKVCHTLAQGERNKIGPNLYGVLDRPAASVQGFKYSAALKASALTWDEATLDQWLQNPRQTVPGTSMSFVGVRDDKARRDLLAYVIEQTASAE